jgi:hypothetical protein
VEEPQKKEGVEEAQKPQEDAMVSLREVPLPGIHEATTLPGTDAPTMELSAEVAAILKDPSLPAELAQPPVPPIDDNGGNDGKKGRHPKRRRAIIAIACILLLLLLIGGGVLAAFTWQGSSNTDTAPRNSATGGAATATPTPVAGPRMIQLALDGGALTSLFASQLGVNQGVMSDLNVVPTPQDGIALSLNLHIDANGIHRVMPIEMDGVLGIDKSQNIQITLIHLRRDGIEADAATTASMGQALNQMLLSSLMPALRGELKSVKLISIHTSTAIGCAHGTEMLVLLIQAPPIQGIAAQPTPVPFCFRGPIDLNKLLPH